MLISGVKELISLAKTQKHRKKEIERVFLLVTPYSLGLLLLKAKKKTNVGKDMEKLKLLLITDKYLTCVISVENSMDVTQKINKITI